MDQFDRLSAELITAILFEVDTTESLHSMIRASPKSYHVFLASKEKILLSLMRRTIQPAAFIDALAAVHASQLRNVRPDRKAVLAFLRKYENQRHRPVEQKGHHYSQPTAVSLCQLYRSTQCFIHDLTGRSTFYLRRCAGTSSIPVKRFDMEDGSITIGPAVHKSIWRSKGDHPADREYWYVPHSDVEEGRLQRAFYRYELYTQIFTSEMGAKLWEIPSLSFFLGKVPSLGDRGASLRW